ncbi:MAG: chemotaxis protein CheW [Gammaproteobacteria bacterium]|nr:chemotaxis protein CheW [Gammaproteobacteria bacterium]
MDNSNLIALLREYDFRLSSKPPGLPGAEVEQGTLWRGIGFRLAGENLVSSLDQVLEVLTDPLISPVPGAKSWVKGIANVRGRLVTIVELADFLGVAQEGPRMRGQRALYAERGELRVGMLVDTVFGAKQFLDEHWYDEAGVVPAPLALYVTGSFVSVDETWKVLNLTKLLTDRRFLDAAA